MFPFHRPAPRDDEARQVVDRAVAALRQHQRAGEASVPVTDVLAMLGADPDTSPPPLARSRDPLADPMTGARWAGPPGSAPPATARP